MHKVPCDVKLWDKTLLAPQIIGDELSKQPCLLSNKEAISVWISTRHFLGSKGN